MSTNKIHLYSDFMAIISGLGGLAAWQEQLDWGLRLLASAVAITAGSVAIYQRLKKRAPSED